MTQQRLFLIQTLLEALIPIIGYFEWGWDLSFILLFYLIDWLLAFGILIAKGKKRFSYSRNNPERTLLIKQAIIGFALLLLTCVGIAQSLVFLHPGFKWFQRIIEFMTYEELGIQQGYVLIPLIVLNGIVLYRQQFIMPARYRTMDMQHITQPFIQQGLILLGFSGALLGITALISFPEEVLIALLIVGTSAYRWLIIRRT